MSLNKICMIFGGLFASSILFSEGVAGLECFHCMFVEGVEDAEGARDIPHNSTCVDNPHPGLSVDCLNLIYGHNNTKGLKGVVNTVNGAFKDLGNSTGQVVEYIRQNQTSQLKFTCAKMRFSGHYEYLGKNITATIRSCIPTLRASGFEEKCHSNELGKLQGQSKDEEVNTILENFAKHFGNETQTDACTCNGNKCNAGFIGNETSKNGKGGSEKSFPFSVAALLATCLFAQYL